jgi:hypothetical protein
MKVPAPCGGTPASAAADGGGPCTLPLGYLYIHSFSIGRGQSAYWWGKRLRAQVIAGLVLAVVLTATVGYTSYVLPYPGQDPVTDLKVLTLPGQGEPPSPTSTVLGVNIDWTDDCQGLYEPVTGFLRPQPVGELITMGPSYLRFPATDLSQSYNWTRGVGKVNERGANPSHGRYPQTSSFGTDEFMALVNHTMASPVVVVNAANGDAQEAADWVSYCNDVWWKGKGVLRSQNGHQQSYGVKYWEIGYDMQEKGFWQFDTDQTTAAGLKYAHRLMDYSMAMKLVDRDIKVGAWLVLHPDLETSGADQSWNINVLTEAGGTFKFKATDGTEYTRRYFDYVVVSVELPRVNMLLDTSELFAYSYAKTYASLQQDLDQLKGLLFAPNEVPIAIASFEPYFNEGGWNTQCAADEGSSLLTANIALEAVRRSVVGDGRRVIYACYGDLSSKDYGPLLINPDFKEARLAGWERSANYFAMRLCAEMQGARPLPIAGLRTPKYDIGGERSLPAIDGVPVVEAFATSDSNGSVVKVMLLNRETDRPSQLRLSLDGWAGQMGVTRVTVSAESLLSNNLLLERVRTVTESWRVGGPDLQLSLPKGSVVLVTLQRSGGT